MTTETKLKVLFVSSGNAKEGVSPIIRNQALSLQKLGLEVELFGIKGKGIKNYYRNIFILRRQIKSVKYDILHAHYGSSALITWIAKKKECLVVSFMGDDILGAKNRNGRFTLMGHLETMVNRIMAFLFYKNIILKTEQMLSYLKRERNTTVIPNGVNIELFKFEDVNLARERLNLEKEEKIVIFVADPARPEKNHNLALMAKKWCNREFQLLTVFNVSRESLKDYYNAADCLVLTSFHEGSPNVVKEAMACDCPVVSTNVGDVLKLFGNEPGYFVCGYDEQAFAGCIEEALRYSETEGRTHGRDRIIEMQLDSKSVAHRIITFYNKSLNVRDLRNNKV